MIEIRALEARDKPVWLALFKAYIEFYEASVGDDVVEKTWERLIAADPNFHICLVAVNEADKPIGLAHVLFHASTWSPTSYCYLEDLFVAPSARQQGVGRALIEATYAAADARGCTRTYWTTQEFNYRARALYDQVATRTPFIRYQR
jgi:GNAT superfamily N-acetyltransferase